jgi:hypothetical protein
MPMPKRELSDHEKDVLTLLGEHVDHGLDESDMQVVKRVQELQREKASGSGTLAQSPRSPALKDGDQSQA